jgi:hypothetical protein
MSTRVALIQRQDRPQRIRRVRLVGMQTAEEWTPGESLLDPVDQITAAADWVHERLGAGTPGLAALVVDGAGGIIEWLAAPTAETPVVQAALARAGAGAAGDEEFEEVGATPPGRFGHDATPADASIQAAGAPSPALNGAPGRLGAITLPDADIRLLIDRLDAHGRSAGRAISIWHALAAAWDPAAQAAPSGDDAGGRIVAGDAPVTACVLIDPEGAIIWSWSRGGSLITGGRMRLARAESGVIVRRADVARVTSDWLSWSAQLGQAPARIVCICPKLPEQEGALRPSAIGEALGGGSGWTGASVDMAVVDDPIEATLDRLARQADLGRLADAGDPAAALVGLSSRPGRAQRGAYLAICAAIVGLAAVLGVLAVRQFRAADRFEAARGQVVADTRELAQTVDPAITRNFRTLILQRIEEITGPSEEAGLRQPPRPILEELDKIALFLQEHGPRITLEEISLTTTSVTVRFTADDPRIAEQVISTARNVAEHVSYIVSRPDGNQVRLVGTWITDAGRPGGGQ